MPGAGPGSSSGPAPGFFSLADTGRPATTADRDAVWEACRIVSKVAGNFSESSSASGFGHSDGGAPELAIAERAQFPAQRRLADRDPNLSEIHIGDPSAAANHAMDRRHRLISQCSLRPGAGCRSACRCCPGPCRHVALRPARVEPHNPVRIDCSPTPPIRAARVREPPS